MIIDVTGIELNPGNGGIDCLGNGEHFDKNGEPIECCCDECDYMICCLLMEDFTECNQCDDEYCPRVLQVKKQKGAGKKDAE